MFFWSFYIRDQFREFWWRGWSWQRMKDDYHRNRAQDVELAAKRGIRKR